MATLERDEFHLTDFRLAGFLVARGAVFIGTEVTPRGDVAFRFDNVVPTTPPNGHIVTVESLVNQYPTSAEQRYDSACRAMHDLVKMKLGIVKKGTVAHGERA